jgi:hypothetical protein
LNVNTYIAKVVNSFEASGKATPVTGREVP